MDAETKRRVDELWPQLGIRPVTSPGARGADLRRRVAARPLRQLRQAAAHALRAAVRAARRAGRLAGRTGRRCGRWRSWSWPSPPRAGRRWGSTASPTCRSTRATRARGTASFRAARSRSRRPGSRSSWPRRSSSWSPALLNPLCLRLSPVALGVGADLQPRASGSPGGRTSGWA